MSALYNMNDRGKQLCEALGTALATDKSYSIIFFRVKIMPPNERSDKYEKDLY